MVLVREPTVGDADALGAIHVAAWRTGYRDGLMPDQYLDSLDAGQRAQMWREGLQRPTGPRFTRLVVEDDTGSVVGFITVGPTDGDPASETGEIYALNVHPDRWGRGYGAALLQAGLQALSAAEFNAAVLWVHPENSRARQFYEGRGWELEGRTREEDVLGVVVPEVRYSIRLTASPSEGRQ